MNLKSSKPGRFRGDFLWDCCLKKSTGQKFKVSPLLNQGFFLKHKTRKNLRGKTKQVLRKKFFSLSKKGQGLIEYLILIALMGVATIAIVRTLNQTVKSRFANAIYALQGKNQKAKTHTLKKEEYQRSDLSDFMSGSASADKR